MLQLWLPQPARVFFTNVTCNLFLFSEEKVRFEKEISFSVQINNAITIGSHTDVKAVGLTLVGSPPGRGVQCTVCEIHLIATKAQKSY